MKPVLRSDSHFEDSMTWSTECLTKLEVIQLVAQFELFIEPKLFGFLGQQVLPANATKKTS